jgi:hypothetical protein
VSNALVALCPFLRIPGGTLCSFCRCEIGELALRFTGAVPRTTQCISHLIGFSYVARQLLSRLEIFHLNTRA